jgi:3-hydroxyisobutyrate dehydrogenase-like beta-hydroxyacid dehydrogenase
MGEAFALGVRCGADPATLYEVIKESSGYSRMMDARLPDFLLAAELLPSSTMGQLRLQSEMRIARTIRMIGRPLRAIENRGLKARKRDDALTQRDISTQYGRRKA